jgi:hypothetical protein
MKEGQPKPHYKKLLAWGAVSAENVARSSPHSRWHKRSPGMYDRRGHSFPISGQGLERSSPHRD